MTSPEEMELRLVKAPKAPRRTSSQKLLDTITSEDEPEKRKQTNVYFTGDEKEIIQRAARRSGARMGQFLRECALAEAKRILDL